MKDLREEVGTNACVVDKIVKISISSWETRVN